jgi:hypothetical protein
MKVYKIPGVLLVVIIIFTSCKEVYFPDDISSVEQTPVIKGMICEGSSPTVSISYAMGYYENTETPVSNATVVITDNFGNQVELLEESAGSYKPASDEFKGVIGRVYTLHVNTPDGNEYESVPVKINERPVIDSIYAHTGELEVISYDPNGEPYTSEKIREGLYVFTDLSAETNSSVYYRFNTSVTKLYLYFTPTMTATIATYVWERPAVIDDFYSVDFSISNNGRQILPEHKIGYLPWIFLGNLPPGAFSLSTRYVLILKVYAISAGVYDYYHSIDQQLNSNNQMFAPVPSQIQTNIRCVNDPARTVSGVFEASSMAVSYKAFLYLDKNRFRSKTLTAFPDSLESGSQMWNPPDFWFDFCE